MAGARAAGARREEYLVAAAVGLLAVWYALPWATLAGGGLFRYPRGDLPQNLMGHLAFQAPGWHWPLLRAPYLAWPAGESVAMMDGNPTVSLIAKLVATVLGRAVNLFGAWLAACLVLLPLAAVYAMRGLRAEAPPGRLNGAVAALTAAVLALLLPAFLFQVIHINLLGQFLLLLALGQAARRCAAAEPPDPRATFGLLLLAVFIHPYLFMFSAATLAAPAVAMLVRRAPGTRDAVRGWAVATLLPIAAFMLASGALGGGGPGFGQYSMNLLGPIWPQFSGLFGPSRPVLDATGYQHEGFNYLAAGNLLLLAGALVVMARGGGLAWRAVWRRQSGLVLVLLALTALAITPRVTAGPYVLLPVHAALLEQLLSPVRASGRAIWVVDDALLLGAVALLAARWPARLFLPAMAAVLALQWLDTAPLRQSALAYLAGSGQTPPPLSLPPGTTLFRTVPLCTPEDVVADESRLLALRTGARLADARIAYPRVPTVCAAALADGLSAPLAQGEARLFLPSVVALVRQDRLGPGVTCASTGAGVLCRGAVR